jgi:hypothetical protein
MKDEDDIPYSRSYFRSSLYHLEVANGVIVNAVKIHRLTKVINHATVSTASDGVV